MKQKIANYTVVIEKEKRTGTKRLCYTAFVPTLGIATEADTLEEVEKKIQGLIEFHLDCLVAENKEIPMSCITNQFPQVLSALSYVKPL